METQKKKCSNKEHNQADDNIYCRECKVYMCNKCEQFHSNLCQTHRCFSLEKDISNIFTGFCKEEEHRMKLEYFCKTHNQLCCAACIAKIKLNKNGNHKDCSVCLLTDIKREKIDKLNENINYLQNLSKTLEESINQIKEIFEKINTDKEELKLKIQKIFTNIRNELNNREDKLLLEVDENYENLYFKEELIKECEKLPGKIQLSIEKSKKIDKNDNELSVLINRCLEVESNILAINTINDKIKKIDDIKDVKIIFSPNEFGVSEFLGKIKIFGKLEKNIGFILSSIINNDINKQNFIFNCIKEKTNQNITKFELIFRMSKNGSKSDDFHKACDNQASTLILIKTTKNKIFGGFTPLNWTKNGGKMIDNSNKTFIFSLNSMKKYDIINKNKYAIICNSNGLSLGNGDIHLTGDLKKGKSNADNSSSFLSVNNLELTGNTGKSNEDFETEEFEVYKVFFDL